MSILKDILQKYKAKKEKAREFEEDNHIQERFIEKHKSANERELERYVKEEREKHIEYELKKFRAKRTRDLWSSGLLKSRPVLYRDNSTCRDGKFKLAGGHI